MSSTAAFPHLGWVARDYRIEEKFLVRIFELEQEFHSRILTTDDPEARKQQYAELYKEVHRLKTEGAEKTGAAPRPELRRLALTFCPEFEQRSVLDVGCGRGDFLEELDRVVAHGELCGLDTSEVRISSIESKLRFMQSDVVRFTVERPYDVVFSHQVLEHIAPADLPLHLESIRRALNPNGRFIVILPNRFWGPQGITRIIDNTFSGKVPAMGSHLNEGTYYELVPLLKANGFKKIRTVLPFGTYFSMTRSLRVYPWINILFERISILRSLSNLLRSGGKPIFKNPVILIAQKS